MYNSYYRKAWTRDMIFKERRRIEKQARKAFLIEILAIGGFSALVAIVVFFVLSM